MPDSRRTFLRHGVRAGLASLTLEVTARAHDQPRQEGTGGPYVDVHTHVGRTWTGDPALSPEALVRWMDEHRVARAVVLPLVSPESSSYLITNERAIEAARLFPDRLIPFCCIDPRTSYTKGKAGLRSMIRELVDQGARGFGELKAGVAIDDPRMMDLYEACDDLHMPVLFHMDELRGTDRPGLPGLERVLKRFPNVPFLGHGPGFWASISGDAGVKDMGGYPTGPVRPGGALDRLFDVYPNLWGDLSAGSAAGALRRDPDFARGFLARRAGRLLFGTDYLRPGQDVPQFEVLGRLDIPAAARARIERLNAMELLRIDRL